MSDIFGTESAAKPQQICVGDDLYGVSVSELDERLSQLRGEITRTEVALSKKRSELSEAETLFNPKAKA